MSAGIRSNTTDAALQFNGTDVAVFDADGIQSTGISYLPAGTGAVATDVQSKLRSLELADYTALRAFTGNETHVQIIGTGIAGLFKVDASDTTSADNGGTVLVDASGRRCRTCWCAGTSRSALQRSKRRPVPLCERRRIIMPAAALAFSPLGVTVSFTAASTVPTSAQAKSATGQVEEFEYEPPILAPEPEKSYAELRAAEYPPITYYIDGIVKGDTAQVQAYIDACLAVKAKYPKPIVDEPTNG